MKLQLSRDKACPASTFGKFYVDGVFKCHTLEDIDRKMECGGEKVPCQTAIPRGSYKVIIDWSNRFKKLMMHVLNVPGFAGVRIHAGNTSADAEGCILLGMVRDEKNEKVLSSRIAVDSVFSAVDAAIKRGESVILEVR